MHCSKKKKMIMMKKMMKKKKKIAAAIHDVFIKLPEDLILKIFSHLPPTYLLRFKSVSKTWYSLISNPDFLRRHTANQFNKRWRHINDLPPPPPPSILLKRYQLAGDSRILILPPPPPSDNDKQPYYNCHQKLSPLLLQNLIDYRPDSEKGRFMLLDSCNGLLLYRNSVKYVIPPTRKYNLYVCNPITHDYIKLPTFEQEEREQGFKIRYYSSPNIVFDPSVSLTYKVVIWLSCTTTIDHETISSSNLEEEEHYRLYVYSSVTRSWRLNQFPVPFIFSFIHWRGVLCNGVLYWSTNYPSFDSNISLCYDVEKDVISTLNFPKMPPEYSNRALLYFGECGGRLLLIEKYYNVKELQVREGIPGIPVFPSIFDVMELDNNDDLWTVKYRVNFGDDQVGYYAELIREYRPSLFGVHILDLYKTKTKKAAGEHEIHQGDQEEEEEELLMNICNICIIPFNLSSNTFGKELRNGENKSVGDRNIGFTEAHNIGFTEVLRYNTITLFPLSSSS